jgi:cell division protein FtsZ
VNEAAEVVTTAADQNANVIFGAVIDDGIGDEVRVTVIATGFGQQRRRRPRLADEAPVGPAPIRPSTQDPGDLDVPSFLRD